MKVGILTIGNELTSGKTQDTNSSYIARELQVQGWPVVVMMSVGDDHAAIKGALDHILALADALIVTGGLGPTADDITTAAIGRAFGRKLYTDEVCLKHIQEIFKEFRLHWTENNAKQALFPEGAETIFNPVGTAWGFSLRVDGKVIAVIPGVPAEVKIMLPEGVIPLFRKAFPEASRHVATRIFKVFGISEAGTDKLLSDIDLEALGVEIGFYPDFPEIHVQLKARTATEEEARERLARAETEVMARLKDNVFGYDEQTLEGVVAELLTERGLTLAVAESLTGGLITDRLTDIPGSSKFFERGCVTYSNRSKTDLLAVPEDILKEHGAVSEQTAVRMAEGVRRQAGTNLGLSTTGIAGPDGGTDEKPVGTVYVALSDGKETYCRHYDTFRWDRRRIKVLSAQAALLMVKRYLKDEIRHEP
ncbi:MAG: competence/damage-inducible protein A [Candidatus Aminicenantes bacterium]|nr:competence/damage-inducible protein A [Candidatus Aminicenantes bacterium]